MQCGMNLARIDKVKLGVIASTIAQDNTHGWKTLKEIYIEGDEIVSQGVSFLVMEYDSTAREIGL